LLKRLDRSQRLPRDADVLRGVFWTPHETIAPAVTEVMTPTRPRVFRHNVGNRHVLAEPALATDSLSTWL
jgi:hypothetical protein